MNVSLIQIVLLEKWRRQHDQSTKKEVRERIHSFPSKIRFKPKNKNGIESNLGEEGRTAKENHWPMNVERRAYQRQKTHHK